jgi:biotin carboxyl carrier protein
MLQVTVNDARSFAVKNEDGQLSVNDMPANFDVAVQANGLISVLFNNKSYTAIIDNVDRKNKEVTLKINGQVYKTAISEPIDQLLNNMGMNLKAMQKAEPVKAPMPGMVLKVLVTAGQQIVKGDGLVILEAMKMENVLKATASATVKAVKVSERTAVEKGTILIELE